MKKKLPYGKLIISYSSTRDRYEILVSGKAILHNEKYSEVVRELKNDYVTAHLTSVFVESPLSPSGRWLKI
jgi:hypothetical protein